MSEERPRKTNLRGGAKVTPYSHIDILAGLLLPPILRVFVTRDEITYISRSLAHIIQYAREADDGKEPPTEEQLVKELIELLERMPPNKR